MKSAETVTFGGSGLDRAGEIRDNPEAVAAAKADPKALAIVFWRGKPLIQMDNPAELVRLSMDHDVLAEATEEPILLGREEDAPRSITIMGDENLPYELLRKILATCRQVNYTHVAFTAMQKAKGKA